jgi:hypothetical protein
MPGSSDIGGLNLPGLFALLIVVGVVLAPVFFTRGDDASDDPGSDGGGGGGPGSSPQPPSPPTSGTGRYRRDWRRRRPRGQRPGRHTVAPPSPRRTPHPEPVRTPHPPTRTAHPRGSLGAAALGAPKQRP